MKNWSKKQIRVWLNKSLKSCSHGKGVRINSKKAEEKIKLPATLWKELSEYAQQMEHARGPWNFNTMFMAGIAIGWAERESRVK